MDIIDVNDSFSCIKQFAILLLAETFKGSFSLGIILNHFHGCDRSLYLGSVLEYILEKTSAKFIIFNIDEAQKFMENHLEQILMKLDDCLFRGIKVFTVITGLYSQRLVNHFQSSRYC